MTERRAQDDRVAVLEEGFRRHEEDCAKRQARIMTKLEELSADVATYKTSIKVILGITGVVVFLMQFFKEAILSWLK